MEINVTQYVNEVDCSDFSNSIFNSGLTRIGEITWRNAMQHVAGGELVTDDQQADLREWISEFGAWSDEDIEAMSDQETNALLLQFVAGDIREMKDHYDTPEEYQQASEDGQASGRLYRGDDDQWYFHVGC